jgi:hypothetical protein
MHPNFPSAECVLGALSRSRWHRRVATWSIALAIALGCVWGIADVLADGLEEKTKVLLITGPSNHPPGTHEVVAGGRLIRFSLENAVDLGSFEVIVTADWPGDEVLKGEVKTVVFLGDQFPPHQMSDAEGIIRDLGKMMARGCGIVCIHFATGLREPDVGPDGDHPLLHWLGGYFASRCSHHRSTARIFTEAEIVPAASTGPNKVEHPVLRGWKTFAINDEPYIDNYFGPTGHAASIGLIELAVSMLPPESPRRQVVAWGVERADGGRGFGVVMPHYYRNWNVEDLRTLILNGIVWTAGREIPENGVRVELPDLSVFERQVP